MGQENGQTKPTQSSKSGKPGRPGSAFLLALIHKTAAAFSVSLTEETQAVYLEQLSAFPEQAIEQGIQRTIREWDKANMMPTLAFIIARCAENQKALAEAAWETVQRLVYKRWHPDIGWLVPIETLRSSGELTAQVEYAIRQCGGLHRIHDCPTDKFNFLRRDFIEAASRYAEEGGDQARISQRAAESTLAQLQQARTQLTVEAGANKPQPIPTIQPKPMKQPQSFEEYQKRMALLRQQRERLGEAP